MTEEDQVLVAKAALAGVRFFRRYNRYWASSEAPAVGRFTIGRAAAYALQLRGMMTVAEQDEYDRRTANHRGPVDVDTPVLEAEVEA